MKQQSFMAVGAVLLFNLTLSCTGLAESRRPNIARSKDPGSAVRFWAVLGPAVLRSDDSQVVSALQVAAKDK